MESTATDDADEAELLDRLHPAARAPARVRVVVGGVIVLVIAALVAAVVVGLLGAGGRSETVVPTPVPDELRPSGSSAAATTTPDLLFVHVLGAVARPGLYEVAPGARVVDVVAAAGGFADGADQGGVNLARVVADGEQIRVPVIGESPPVAAGGSTGGSGGGGTAPGPINLNTATIAELDTLPRIGPGMAQRILDWREANGRFASVDDLRQVSGIGDKTFEALKSLVTV